MNRKGCFKLIATAALLVAVILQLTGCAAYSPAGRAQSNPLLLERLAPEERELVLNGQIKESMNKDAVFLAWGRPDAVTTGSDRGRATETWRYATLRPVYYPGGPFYYGAGYMPRSGYYGRRIYPYAGAELSPAYVPVTSAVVKFRDGRVAAWESDAR